MQSFRISFEFQIEIFNSLFTLPSASLFLDQLHWTSKLKQNGTSEYQCARESCRKVELQDLW